MCVCMMCMMCVLLLQTPRPPLQPSGNAMPSPRLQVSARYASMPTPLFDSADTTPLPTARDSIDGGGPLSARGEPPLSYRGEPTVSYCYEPPVSYRGEPPLSRGIPRSSRGDPPLSARGHTLSSEISPRIPLPSPRQLSRYTRIRMHGGASDGIAAVGAGKGPAAEEDPVERSWRLAKEEAEVARKRRVRQHAAVAAPELMVRSRFPVQQFSTPPTYVVNPYKYVRAVYNHSASSVLIQPLTIGRRALCSSGYRLASTPRVPSVVMGLACHS